MIYQKKNTKMFHAIKHKGDVFSKAFKNHLDAAKWVDKKCLVLGIPQKNNLFKKL